MAGFGPEEQRHGGRRPTAILGMVLTPGAGLPLASLWAAYKAWCETCLCEYNIKGTNPPAQGVLPFKSFCIHFSNDNSLYPAPPFPPPQGRFIEKNTLYGNIANTPSAGLFRDSV